LARIFRMRMQRLCQLLMNHRKLIGTAKLRAAQVIGGLAEFYRRISSRSDHFREVADGLEKSVAD
ncbi:hypothetical protein ACC730_37470, partial [Rhizobium ruizarguesonis]